MANAKLTKAKEKEIVSYAGSELTSRQIAERTGVHYSTVTQVFNKHGKTLHHKEKLKEVAKKISVEARKGGTFRDIAKRADCEYSTVMRHLDKGLPGDDIVNVELPPGISKNYTPFVIDTPGMWGVISDIHIPCHDDETLRLFVAECKRRAVRGVILNGDILDSHEVSDHDKDPSMPRYQHELELGRQFLAWMRQELPNARIIYKHGNHEERVNRYIFRRAPALEGLPGLNVRSWLEMDKHGIEDLPGKRVIELGKLHVVHGHEYRGGGGVNPARWLFLRARSVAVCGHFHRTSEHHERNIALKYEAAWSIGCACDLHPEYAPLNNWNHGFAFCEVANDGNFAFENRRVFGGKVV